MTPPPSSSSCSSSFLLHLLLVICREWALLIIIACEPEEAINLCSLLLSHYTPAAQDTHLTLKSSVRVDPDPNPITTEEQRIKHRINLVRICGWITEGGARGIE